MPRAKPTTLRVYVAYHPRQGLRLNMAGRTKRAAWDQLIGARDEDRLSRLELKNIGWKVLRCTVIAEPEED